MAKIGTKWLVFDLNSLENSGGNLQVRVVTAGALERTASGVNVKNAGITDAMLEGDIAFAKLADSANIGRLDQSETVVGKWNFPDGANIVTINGKAIATQEYADSVAAGLDLKDSVKALSTTNRALTDLPSSVDGVTTWSAGDRILLNAQTNQTENGIWEVQTGAWTRPNDFATGMHVAGAFTFIEQGTNNAESGWVCVSDKGSDVVDTDTISFTQFSGAGQVSAGIALSKSGSTLNFVPSAVILGGAGEIDGDKLAIDYVPTNYTRDTSPSEVDDVKHLTSHLKGLNNRFSEIGQSQVDRFTLSSTDISNKYITLSHTPRDANRVTLRIRGAGSQQYGDDYAMDGSINDRLTWAGLDLDGQVSAGDKFTVRYDY